MPTFKAQFANYNPKLTPEQNLNQLFDSYNDFVSRVTYTVNNLDDENISSSLFKQNSTEG